MEKGACGQGAGANYKHWIEVTDFSSHGQSRRAWGRKTMRTHNLQPDFEYHMFLMAEWSDSVLDIWEQYPLDCDLTQAIAQAACGKTRRKDAK
jgi:hypothetical protein